MLQWSSLLSLFRASVLVALPVGATLAAPTVAAADPTPQQAAAPPKLNIELNKLEATERGCRIYIVVNNETEIAYSAFKLDLVVFQPDGVYAQGLKLSIAPIRPAKRSVKVFDLDGLACDRIGSVLVNDAVECRSDTGPISECLGGLTFTSLSSVKITK